MQLPEYSCNACGARFADLPQMFQTGRPCCEGAARAIADQMVAEILERLRHMAETGTADEFMAIAETISDEGILIGDPKVARQFAEVRKIVHGWKQVRAMLDRLNNDMQEGA